MVARTRWTLRLDRLVTRLPIGSGRRPPLQPIDVGLTLQALVDVAPDDERERIDLEALCAWITTDWPTLPPTLLLEARTAELMAHVFAFDRRIQHVEVRLRRGLAEEATGGRIAVERDATRAQFEAQQRMVRSTRTRSRSDTVQGRES